MKLNLLEIVQDILNDITGDEVNSIDDTLESEQVANIVRSTYRSFINNRNWPHTKKLLTLIPSGDIDFPTHLTIDEDLKELVYVSYNKAKDGSTRRSYEKIKWLENDEFLMRVNSQDDSSSSVKSVTDPSGVILAIRNDVAPSYFTSFDDETLVFDSYDSEVDDTLVASKFQAIGYVIPAFQLEDTFIPDLPSEAFPAFVEECKSRASLKLNQVQDAKSEVEAQRQQRWLSRKSWRINGGIKYPNYGRKGRK